MSMASQSLQIHLPTYFKVLEKLPGVDPKDLKLAEAVLKNILGDQYSNTLTFDRGKYFGDGIIHVNQVYLSEGKNEILSSVDIEENGFVRKSGSAWFHFLGIFSPVFAPYFLGGIFGIDEMKKKPSDDYVL